MLWKSGSRGSCSLPTMKPKILKFRLIKKFSRVGKDKVTVSKVPYLFTFVTKDLNTHFNRPLVSGFKDWGDESILTSRGL